MPQTTGAKASIEDILRAQAVRTAAALIKNRARTYAKAPILLDTVAVDFRPPRLRPSLRWQKISF